MGFRIVSDSSSNVLSMGEFNYTTVPLKVVAEKEYVPEDVLKMLEQKPIQLPAWVPMFAPEE